MFESDFSVHNCLTIIIKHDKRMQWAFYNCRYLGERYCTSRPYYQHGALLSPSIKLTGPFCEANIRKKIYSCHEAQFHYQSHYSLPKVHIRVQHNPHHTLYCICLGPALMFSFTHTHTHTHTHPDFLVSRQKFCIHF